MRSAASLMRRARAGAGSPAAPGIWRRSTITASAARTSAASGDGAAATYQTQTGRSGRVSGSMRESRWRAAGPRTRRRTSSDHTGWPSTVVWCSATRASTPRSASGAGTSTTVRPGWRAPRRCMAFVAAVASSSSTPTTTSVTHAVRVAAWGSPRRRRTRAAATSAMVTSSPSHTERGWSGRRRPSASTTELATGGRPTRAGRWPRPVPMCPPRTSRQGAGPPPTRRAGARRCARPAPPRRRG